MPNADNLIERDRIAALIEECRAEREACACVRDQCHQGGVRGRTIHVALGERLLAGAVDVQASTRRDDPAS